MREQQRRNDRFDQAEENRSQNGEPDRLFGKHGAESNAGNERDDDPAGERYPFHELLLIVCSLRMYAAKGKADDKAADDYLL